MSKPLYSVLRSYHRGPEHPFKLKIFYGLLRMLGRPCVIVDYAQSARLCVDPFEYIGSQIVEDGSFEPEVAEVLEMFIDKNDVFWDIGAHIGSNSVAASTDPRIASVHAFECAPETLEMLRFNRELNGKRFEVHPFALSDKSGGSITFWASADQSSKSSLEELPSDVAPSAFRAVQVRVTTIDAAIRQGIAPKPTLIKADVEGHEAQVFAGATKTLSDTDLKVVIFESRHDGTGQILDRNLHARFVDAGFVVGRLLRKNGHIQPNENYVAYRTSSLAKGVSAPIAPA